MELMKTASMNGAGTREDEGVCQLGSIWVYIESLGSVKTNNKKQTPPPPHTHTTYRNHAVWGGRHHDLAILEIVSVHKCRGYRDLGLPQGFSGEEWLSDVQAALYLCSSNRGGIVACRGSGRTPSTWNSAYAALSANGYTFSYSGVSFQKVALESCARLRLGWAHFLFCDTGNQCAATLKPENLEQIWNLNKVFFSFSLNGKCFKLQMKVLPKLAEKMWTRRLSGLASATDKYGRRMSLNQPGLILWGPEMAWHYLWVGSCVKPIQSPFEVQRCLENICKGALCEELVSASWQNSRLLSVDII